MLLLLTIACATDPVLDGLVVQDVPNPLAARVRWHTSQPGTSRVEVRGGELAFAVERQEAVTEHEVLVYGLVAQERFELVATSSLEDGTELRSDPATMETGALPFAPLDLEISHHQPESEGDGWVLLNLVQGNFLLSPPVAVALDHEGRVRWLHHLGPEEGPAGVEVRRCNGEAIILGGSLPPGVAPTIVGLDGEVIWEGDSQPEGWFDPEANHHTLQCLDGGRHLVGLFYAGLEGDVLGDYAMAFDQDLQTYWTWRSWEHLPAAASEHIHLNMLQLDQQRAWINSFFLAELYEIDTATGEIQWTFGATGDFELLEGEWFEQAHGFEVLGGDRVLMYDNGMQRGWSRAVEYQLDPQDMTATEIWSWPPAGFEGAWHNGIWGDADRLPGGSTLVAGGSLWSVDDPCRLYQIDAQGEPIWELHFLDTEAGRVGTYAVEWWEPGLVPLD